MDLLNWFFLMTELVSFSSLVIHTNWQSRTKDLHEVHVHVYSFFELSAGADTEKDDGVYSAYFTSFAGNSRYSVSARVSNEDGKAAIKKAGPQAGGAASKNPCRFQSVLQALYCNLLH